MYNPELGGVAGTLEERMSIQNYLYELKTWSEISKEKFNKDKCKYLTEEREI